MTRILKTALMSLFSLLLSYIIIYAQTDDRKLDILGQIRVRSENDMRDFDNDTEDINYTLLRTRLNFKFNHSDKVIAFAQLQDSRTLGTEGSSGTASTLANFQNVDLHQGYIQINRLFFPWLSYKFGRMKLSYGNERLVGANQWSNIGRAFDGNVVSLKFKSLQLDLLNAILYESLTSPSVVNGDQVLNLVWLKLNTIKPHELDIYVITDEDREKNSDDDFNMNRSTIGTRFNGEFGNLGIETEINFQAGKMDFTQDIRAFYLSGAFTYTFNKRINLEYTIGADYLSGDKSDTDKYECFNTLYPAKHRFFGYMDYFTDIPRDTRDLGLTDIMAKARIKPLESISLKGDFHIFKLSQNATLNDGSSSKDLGMEIDFTFAYDYLKNVNFTFGSSMFFPGKVFKDWKGSDPSLWFYAQTTVNF